MLSKEFVDELRTIGEEITVKGNETYAWDHAQFVWFVVEGEVNLFAVPYEQDEIAGKREYLFSVSKGESVIGIDNTEHVPLRLLLCPMSETDLIKIDRDAFFQLGEKSPHVHSLVNEWEASLRQWMKEQYVAETDQDVSYSVMNFFSTVYTYLVKSAKEEVERLEELEKLDEEKLKQSLLDISGLFSDKTDLTDHARSAEENVLVRTCQLIGDKIGVSIKAPLKKLDDELDTAVRQIAKASNIRTRQVTLKPGWTRGDHGALLCFVKEDLRPVALIPTIFNRYEIHDLTTDTVQKMPKEMEKQIHEQAYMFYRPLPAKKLNVIDLLKYSTQTPNVKKDFTALIILGVLGGLLSLAIPIGVGQLVDSIIPAADRSKMFDFILILTAMAIAVFTFEMTRSLAVLRLEGRLDFLMQAAVWDRVLNLPVPFFRKFTAGDLALRANSISVIREMLSGTTLATIFTGLFSFTQFFLLFFFNRTLASIAAILTLGVIVFTFAFGMLIVRNERKLVAVQGKLTGLVFQIINGISKFRVSGSEKRAFKLWGDYFSVLRNISFKTGLIENHFLVFNAVYPIAATIVLFYTVWAFLPSMSTGTFLAFYAAFSSFIVSMTAMTLSLISTLSIVPLYERAKPILEALPEFDDEKEEVTELNGEIEVNRINFRYENEGPLILKDVSFRVSPGEFVAIVGSSGSGKSTLLRLLLGFEKPISGTVYYDKKDLSNFDVQSLRSKLGVVLQNGQMLTGDIYTNIVGSANLSMDDAWEAARMAGLEEDIKKMPMGMFTVVDEGARTLSGGQRQRLLIARALVNKPKVIFFDEATSALDNRTQKVVSDSIENLRATRVIIAHRLSTIMNADRIYVLEKGKIVEEGTFNELMEKNGVFTELAKRQMA